MTLMHQHSAGASNEEIRLAYHVSTSVPIRAGSCRQLSNDVMLDLTLDVQVKL